MIAMALSMAQDTDASTSTSTCRKSHMKCLNNHVHKRNGMVSLKAPSASCDRKQAIVMYMPKLIYDPQMPHLSPIWQLVHVHIWDNHQYIWLAQNQCNQQCDQEHRYTFHIIGICPWKNIPSIVHACPTALLLWSTYRPPHYCTYKSPQKTQQFAMGTLHIISKCAWKKYAPQMPHIQISSCTDMKQLCKYIYPIWTYFNQQCDQKHCCMYI